jgi:hypothetical protein
LFSKSHFVEIEVVVREGFRARALIHHGHRAFVLISQAFSSARIGTLFEFR